MAAKFKFELGLKAKDKMTGIEGVIVGRTDYLTGCRHYGLLRADLDKDGKIRDWEWFDESRLELVKEKKVEKGTSGGPAPSAPQM